MDIWAVVGTGIALSVADVAQKHVMQPFVRTLKRWMPNGWVKRILFFDIQKSRRTRQ